MDKALRHYRSAEDPLTVAKQLLRLQRRLTKIRSALIQEQVEATLARPTLERKDIEILKKLLHLKLSS
jgi:hypothetical protein